MLLRKLTLLLPVVVAAASGNATAQLQSIMHDGIQRTYLAHLPPGFSSSDTLPVVFSLHGLVMNAQSQSDLSQFNPIADRERFIAVYPNGINNSWNTFGTPYNGGVDDVGFISALIDTLYRDYHIDLSRVYSCGMSNGGFMSYRLACELSDRIAAIASVTGSMTDSMIYYCNPSRPFPVLHFHGTSDPIVNYTGVLGSIKSVADDMNYWVQNNNCPSQPVETQEPDINSTDQTTATRLYWGLCDESTEVIHYKINGGGHTWPGSPEDFFGVGGAINLDVMASELIWEFFSKYSLTGNISVPTQQAAVNRIRIYPNPVDDLLKIASDERGKIRLTDLSGKEIIEQEFNAPEVLLNLGKLPGGAYLLLFKSSSGTEVSKIFRR